MSAVNETAKNAESAVIGSLIIHALLRDYDGAINAVKPLDAAGYKFRDNLFHRAYSGIVGLMRAGSDIDLISISSEICATQDEFVDLTTAMRDTPSAKNIDRYVGLLLGLRGAA
jgi:replicative DNA helicase